MSRPIAVVCQSPPLPPAQGRPPTAAAVPSQAIDERHSSTHDPSREQIVASSCAAPSLASRRTLLSAAAVAVAALALPDPAAASKLPEVLDRAWEGLGGGPADLVFPDEFQGVWDVDSVLTAVEMPLGPEFVPDMRVVQRAQQEDLNAVVRYQVAFVQNARGEVVPDRRFNTASLLHTYMGTPTEEVQRRIDWDPNDPNMLQMGLPGGLQVTTRVTRRAEERPADSDRLTTSEYFQQLISTPQLQQPKVKASRCFTKYHWRNAEQAAAGDGGGVQIVATQVVSDYLTSFDDPAAMMEARGQPVVVYTYRMAFRRPARQTAAAGAGSETQAAAQAAVALS